MPPKHILFMAGALGQIVFMSIFILGQNIHLMDLSIALANLSSKMSIIVINICIVMTLSDKKK